MLKLITIKQNTMNTKPIAFQSEDSPQNVSLPSFSKKYLYSFLLLMFLMPSSGYAQMTTIQSGSFIINMGVSPQTIANGLKPYGMIYDLILNYKVPIKWIIAPGKIKDGIDFSYNGIDYKGGPFIILAEYRSAAVNSRIAYWTGQGVIGVTTTSPIEVPVAKTLLVSSVPRWTIDSQNGSVAVPYFANAGIPALAYSIVKTPSALGFCDDIFVMPHADPTWATHSNLYFWNLTYHGSIWTNCHAGSTLEDMFNPANKTQQTNFLAEKTGTAVPDAKYPNYSRNALFLYDDHTQGTTPYSYAEHGDPFMQCMGSIDAATQNGSEQIYIPMSPGWRSTTKIAVWDPDHVKPVDAADNHRAAVVAYGRAFGDPNRGYVMIEAAHSFNRAALPPNIAAQRIFFNFSFMAGKDATILPDLSGIPSTVVSGTPTPVSFTFPVGINPNDYTVSWFSSCGGTFAVNPAYPTDKTKAIYSPPAVTTTTSCPLTVSITDACGRVFNTTKSSTVSCEMAITTSLTNACNAGSNGSITMVITGTAGAYNWTWTRSGGGTGSGSGLTITGLSAGSYTVNVISGGGSGCARSFTVTISSSPAIAALSLTQTNVLCNGYATGSITVANPTGGIAPFTYLWTGGATTQNRSGLVAGLYSVTASDANNCSVSASATITQASGMTITPTVTNVACYGQHTGAVSVAISGGTGTPVYAWNDGVSTQNRTGLAAGTYSLNVTDANGCTKSSTGIVVSQPTVITASAAAGAVLCNGGTTTLTVTASGGTGSLQYSLNGGSYQAGNTFAVSASGTAYIVTVKDANNCTATTNSVTVTQPTALTLSTEITHVTCPPPTLPDGKIVLTASGGTPTYTYKIDSGSYSSTLTYTALTAGSHTVTVKDANGCTMPVTVILNTLNSNPTAPTIKN